MSDFLDVVINGVSGLSLGVYLKTPPDIPIAAEDGEWITIAGRSGEVWRGDGRLKSGHTTLALYLAPQADLGQVASWLCGMETLRIAPWPWFWRARAADAGAALEHWETWTGEGYEAEIKITVEPYRYLYPEAGAQAVASGDNLANTTNTYSEPLIDLTGSGDITLMIGAYSLLITGLAGRILIDCALRIAYDPATLASRTGQLSTGGGYAAGDPRVGCWPRLEPGNNLVTASGAVTALCITPKWRWR